MRIAQISTPHIPTPPPAYGGSESVASELTEELVKRGHKVTLFAAPGSNTAATLVTFPEARDALSFDQRELVHVAKALAFASDFDIIHNHCLAAGPALANLSPKPIISTLHYLHNILRFFPDHNYVAVSRRQKQLAADLKICEIIHNGIDLAKFPMVERKDEYLLFLGRFHPNKGAHLAIEAATRAGLTLVIAAPMPPPDQQSYFDTLIKPRLGKKVKYVGEVARETKAELLGKAMALLAPYTWDEPFGLVLLEAMACGTPVIATNRGSVPEIVVDGKTGYVVQNIDEMVDAIKRVVFVAPSECRRRVAENFSVAAMADKYIALYKRILG